MMIMSALRLKNNRFGGVEESPFSSSRLSEDGLSSEHEHSGGIPTDRYPVMLLGKKNGLRGMRCIFS